MIQAGLLIVLAGLSGLTPGATEERVRQVLSDLRERHGFPGATVAWASPGNTGHTLAVGMADPDSETPMTPDTRMLAASIGKSFVASAILRAAEKGWAYSDTGYLLAAASWKRRRSVPGRTMSIPTF